MLIVVIFGNGKFWEPVGEQHVRKSLPCCGCPRMVSLSRGPSRAVHFFGLASFLHKVNIPITLVAQHHHALNVRTAEVINDY